MSKALSFLILLVAVMHFTFMIIEMFFWTKPLGRRIFGLSVEKAGITKSLAANQGLYNGFLGAGLCWSLLHPVTSVALELKLFFLLCVVVAGVFGALTVSAKILLVQSGPAVLALILIAILNT